jgi:hypothetical protein
LFDRDLRERTKDLLVDLNQRRPPLPAEDGAPGVHMPELKIALMVVMIAILFFAIYFTAIPG